MPEHPSHVSLVALTVVADAVALNNPSAALPVGATSLLLLLADGSGQRSTLQSLAHAAGCGFAATVALVPVFHLITPYSFGLPVTVVLWIVATLLFALLELVRSGSRVPDEVPNFRQSARSPIAPATTPNLVQRAEPLTEPPPESSVEPPPTAMPLRGGKPATIYVNLVGEGMTMLRPVKAEHIRRDFYLISEEMPENERWEFGPGQVVRCEKKNLSSGKALVAVQEAPRAQ